MRVTRLDIFGFKSFMERLVLPLESGITGIVGPNGCGKSNVVDALRWVLGETRASNLRGGVLEDVIFNGTDKLRPLGLAEVTITLRANDENFFSDLVSPGLEIEELIKSLAIEEPSESETEEEVLGSDESDKSSEIEGSEEEKVPHLRVIKGNLGADASAENLESPKQESTREEEAAANRITILTRFSWLKSVNEVQVTRRLYRSGESEFFINRVPCRLKDIKDLFRAIGLGARAYTVVAQGEVSRIVTAKPEERRLILEEAAGVVGFRDKIASTERKLEETGVNISRLKDVIGEVERQVGSLRRQAHRAENRQKLKDEIASLERALFQDRLASFGGRAEALQKNLSEAESQEASAGTALQAALAKEESCRADLMAFDVEGDAIRSRIDSIKEELLNRSRSRGQKISRVNELKAFNLARGTEVGRLEERRTTLMDREKEAQRELEELANKEAELSETLKRTEISKDEELKGIAGELFGLREELKVKDCEIRGIRERSISAESSITEIKEQLVAASPITQLQRTAEGEGAELLMKIASEVKMFVDGLTVPAEYAKAVQSILAERSAFLVSDKPNEIAHAFVGGAKKGMGLGIFKSGDFDADIVKALDAPGVRLLDVVGVAEKFRLAAGRIFGGVYICDSGEEAFKFFAAHPKSSEISFVTKEGDLITDYSFFSLRHEGGLVQLKNRLEEYQGSLLALEAVQTKLSSDRELILEQISSAESRQREALAESERQQAYIRDLSNQQANVRGRLHAERKVIEQISQDLGRVGQQISELTARITENQTEEARIQEELKATVTADETELETEAKRLTDDYQSFDIKRKEGRGKLSDHSNEVQRIRRELDDSRALVSSLTLEKQKLDLERGNIYERIVSEYGEDFYNEVVSSSTQDKILSDDARSDFESETHKLKARVIREGDVDSSSIERYREESDRLENLEKQLHDLEEAAHTLKRTISRLTEVSEKRFLSMFHAVSRNFSKLVPRLFGGGKANLELTDPSNPLESGVEIIARPPGKKLKSIDLMSGGEKALCATALIFAMFMEKPSPLCVLDEVDAPLDDANLMRFLSLVKEMSQRTQFLIITHNKQSMTTADNLIGVTMQEPGASKVISVSLQEAFSQVA